jgi:hypothetical protein
MCYLSINDVFVSTRKKVSFYLMKSRLNQYMKRSNIAKGLNTGPKGTVMWINNVTLVSLSHFLILTFWYASSM